MTLGAWNRKFFGSTRGRIVGLLRRERLTVDDIAVALELTDNAVRAQLLTLETDGIARPAGQRRTGGKPAVTYELSPAAHASLSRAYRPLLLSLLDEMGEKMGRTEMDELMRSTGRRLASRSAFASADLATRVRLAAELLSELGGLVEVQERPDVLEIRGHGCPLGEAIEGHPSVCRAIESLVSEMSGAPVTESCMRSGPPSCRFLIARSA